MSDANDLPWFKCWAAETLSDERFQGWSCEERGAFWTLLCLQWREGSIPADPSLLRRFLHLDGPAFQGVWQAIGDRFGPSGEAPGRLENPRMADERHEVLNAIRMAKETGRQGADKRWGSSRGGNGGPIGGPSFRDGPPNARQDKIRQDEIKTDSQTEVARLAGLVGSALGRKKAPGLGRDPARTLSELSRWVDAVGVDETVAECVRLAQAHSVVPSHMSWFVGWLETVPDAKLRRDTQ